MSKIHDFPLSFSLVKGYVIFTFRRFYGEFIVTGRENIPEGTPVIFAPNHINALMDALAVHAVVPHRLPLIFLARSDLFKKPAMARLLHFMKMLPAFRMRDGIENLDKNNEIFDRCVDVLDNNATLGIMPEGNQGAHHRLRPIVKGIFRIAFSAQQKYGMQPGVKIIPVGINLGDLIKSGKHIIVNIGKPIEVADYMESYLENPVTATNEIRNRLRDDLSSLSLDLASETYYDCLKSTTRIANTAYLRELNLSDNTYNRFVARQEISKRLIQMEENETERIAAIDNKCIEYERNLKKLNLKEWVFERAPFTNANLLHDGWKLLGTLPFFLYGLLVNVLPYLGPPFIRKYILKTKDSGFFSSVHFALGMITFPVFYALQTVLFYNFTPLPWWASVIFLLSQYPMGKGALKWYNKWQRFMAKIRYRKLENKNRLLLRYTNAIRLDIIRLLTEKKQPCTIQQATTKKKEVQI